MARQDRKIATPRSWTSKRRTHRSAPDPDGPRRSSPPHHFVPPPERCRPRGALAAAVGCCDVVAARRSPPADLLSGGWARFTLPIIRRGGCAVGSVPTATANRFSPAASKRGERRRGLHAAGVEAVERLGATCALLLCLWCAWWHVVAFGMMIRCHEMMVIGCAMLVCGVRP